MRELADEDYQRAYRYAVALAGDPQDGFDLLHSVLSHLLGAALPDDAGLPYLLRAVRNRHIDQCRQRSRQGWTSQDVEDDASSAAVIATDFSALEDLVVNEDLLRQCWLRLGAAEREVLHLWAVEGFTVDEIAVQTDTPRGTLLARLHRLRRRLQDLSPYPVAHRSGSRS